MIPFLNGLRNVQFFLKKMRQLIITFLIAKVVIFHVNMGCVVLQNITLVI